MWIVRMTNRLLLSVVLCRVVHRSGRVVFGPNPDSTHRRQVEGGGTWNRPPEKLVESVSGEGEHRSVRSVAGVKNHRNLEKKRRRNLENHAGICIFFR